MKPLFVLLFALLLGRGSVAFGQTQVAAPVEVRPKYGPTAIRLFDSREFIQQAAAPDYWALMPYYVGQPNDASCSLASITMVINAMRAHQKLRADQPLATHAEVIQYLKPHPWVDKVRDHGDGLTLDELQELTQRVTDAFQLGEVQVRVIRLPEDDGEALSQLRALLTANETSDRDFLIANFLQSILTGDPEGAVGHMAPIGAYDARSQRVLIMDPDRTWYEPYWSPDTALLKALNTTDSLSGRRRGLIRVSCAAGR